MWVLPSFSPAWSAKRAPWGAPCQRLLRRGFPCRRRERDPATPKDSSAGGPEAFSFPVTPPSEPAPAPTAVFNSWSSFKQSLRPRGSRREGVPDGGSECTTDDEGGDPARWSTLSNKSSAGGSSAVIQRTRGHRCRAGPA